MSWSVAPYAAVLRGALDEAEGALGLPDVGPWALAASAAGAVLDPLRFGAPALDALGAWRGRDAASREAIGCACAHLGRAALLGFDAPGLERVLALHAEVVAGLDPGSEASLWRVIAEGWRAWLRGAPMPDDALLEPVEARARTLGSAAIVIDACALRALGAESRGDTAAMLAMARRASRMARTEALPAQEHLAHVVLARARRWARHPHLAIRILGALDRFVEGPCRAWVRWERLLSGDGDALEGEKADASDPPAVRASVGSPGTELEFAL